MKSVFLWNLNIYFGKFLLNNNYTVCNINIDNLISFVKSLPDYLQASAKIKKLKITQNYSPRHPDWDGRGRSYTDVVMITGE
jgi:hypothetical protein